MTKPVDFQNYRVLIDESITYDDLPTARRLAQEALQAAQWAEVISERMYFTAQSLIIEEDFGEALKYLDLAIQYNSGDGAAYSDRALCMIELGQGDGALDFFNKGIEVEPDFATIHHNKGWFLNRLGRHTEALVCFDQALALDPRRAVTYENKADCFYKMGRITEAIEAYQRAVSLLSNRCIDIKKELERLICVLQSLRSQK